MPDVTVKLSDGIREITVEISGSDEAAAVRLLDRVATAIPPSQRASFDNWALSSDTERSPEE